MDNKPSPMTIGDCVNSESEAAAAPANGAGALVVGGDFQGLGIVRSLGRRGIPVCVIDDEHSIARFSRYAARAVRFHDLRNDQPIVEAVLDVGRRLGLKGWVLYPTRDEMVAAFSRHRDELSEYFKVPTPAWDVVRWAWDKRNTYQLANQLGIPTPRTWYPQDLDELRGIEAEFPLVVKPAIKEHFFYTTKAKAWMANSRQELEKLFQKAATLTGWGETMLQELIPGDSTALFAYCTFFKQGHALGSMVTNYRRQHPRPFGRASTFVRSIELPELEMSAQRFLSAIGYYGLAELEYKYDSRDCQYKLLDVNARTWSYHSLGLQAGVDFPYLLFADQVGEKVEPCRGRPGVSWIRLVTDLPAGLIEVLGGHIRLRDYWRSLRGSITEAVFSREDPLPGLAELALLPYMFYKRGF